MRVLALAIAVLAWGSPVIAAHAVNAHDASVAVLACGSDVAPYASDPLPTGPWQAGSDPAAEPDGDTAGPEPVAPEAVALLGGMGLDAPRASRLHHRATSAEDTMDRAILPVVQPPRG